MIIISHRGLWNKEQKGNSLYAIRESFERGFGTELDIRDQGKRIVLSHDAPGEDEVYVEFQDAVELWKKQNTPGYLAIDVKACGLSSKIGQLIKGSDNYFFFGMALPDMLEYRDKGLSFFTRVSEYEKDPLLYADADGVWLDLFDSDDDLLTEIDIHLDNKKKVCIVSAELNGRSCEKQWKLLKDSGLGGNDALILCTDDPQGAKEYFKEQ